MDSLLSFLNKLEERKIYYRLNKVRDDSILIEIAVPGERWEVDFFADNHVEVERFASSGEIRNESELEILFRDFSD